MAREPAQLFRKFGRDEEAFELLAQAAAFTIRHVGTAHHRTGGRGSERDARQRFPRTILRKSASTSRVGSSPIPRPPLRPLSFVLGRRFRVASSSFGAMPLAWRGSRRRPFCRE